MSHTEDTHMNRSHYAAWIAVALCPAGAIACGGASHGTTKPTALQREKATLQRTLDRLTAAGVPGAVVLVRNGNQTLRVTSGHANVEKRTPMRASDRFRIGSVTKSFTAAVALQLVGEGRLALDDTVEHWLPGLLAEKNPTIRELLNHTSGLFDYTDDPRFFERLLEHPKAVWTPRRMVRIATAHGPNFAPGSRWWYSNTAYIVLGMVIEAATRHSVATEISKRILAPLRLRSTSFDTSPRIAGTYAHGYAFLEGGLRRDMSIFSPSAPWAAGAIVSTADDVASFYRALLGGRLLRPHLLHAMRTTVPIPLDPRHGRSGLGLFAIQSPCGRIWGHDGQFAGYHTLAWSSRHAKRQVVVMVNADPLPDETTEEALKRLVDAAYCGRAPGAIPRQERLAVQRQAERE